METKVLGTMNQGQVAEFMSQLEQLVKSYNTTIRPGKLVADVMVGIRVHRAGAVPAEPAKPKEGIKKATPAEPVAKGKKKDEE